MNNSIKGIFLDHHSITKHNLAWEGVKCHSNIYNIKKL